MKVNHWDNINLTAEVSPKNSCQQSVLSHDEKKRYFQWLGIKASITNEIEILILL